MQRLDVSKVHTILAAGCRACMLLRIVAPSFVTITSPFEVWIYSKKLIFDLAVVGWNVYHFVHPSWTQRSPNSITNG